MHNKNRPLTTPLLLAALALVLPACTGPFPQRGGRATTTGAISQALIQSDNPSQPSRQTQDTIRTRTYTVPTRATSSSLVPSATSTLSRSDALPSEALAKEGPTLVTDFEQVHATTELGAAQKDTARELAAKLSSLRGIVWVGLALFAFGLTSLFWPPLRAIIGSITTSAAITLGGVGLMILPTLVVGHELLILGVVTLAVGGWFLAHRHGHLRGQLEKNPVPGEGGPALRSFSEGGRHGHARGQLAAGTARATRGASPH